MWTHCVSSLLDTLLSTSALTERLRKRWIKYFQKNMETSFTMTLIGTVVIQDMFYNKSTTEVHRCRLLSDDKIFLFVWVADSHLCPWSNGVHKRHQINLAEFWGAKDKLPKTWLSIYEHLYTVSIWESYCKKAVLKKHHWCPSRPHQPCSPWFWINLLTLRVLVHLLAFFNT